MKFLKKLLTPPVFEDEAKAQQAFLLGGRIWLKSLEREGTTFYFTLPTQLTNRSSHRDMRWHHRAVSRGCSLSNHIGDNMCGRFTLTVDPAELKEAFQDYKFPTQFAPRFNIAPSQPILAIPNNGLNTADFFVWGLVPGWAKEPDIGNRLINARGETLAEKPAFRGSYKYKRCLILADGFYEWKSQPGTKTKTPYFIHMKDHKPFAFAGLWDEWNGGDGSQVRSCTIITTGPNELMSPIHDRMPVILDPADYGQWLDTTPQTPDNLQPLIRPFPAGRMSAYPVSTLVNKPSLDNAELIQPA